MKASAILILWFFLPHFAIGQNSAEKAVGILFGDINKELGNLYLSDFYKPTIKLEYLHAKSKTMKEAIALIEGKKMKFVDLNYSQVKTMVEKSRIKSRDDYSALEEFNDTGFPDSTRNSKLIDALQKRGNMDLHNDEKGVKDTLLYLELGLLQTSSLDRNYTEYYRQSHKKLWMINSVYESSEYFIIFSILMTGNSTHTAIQRADLILK